MKCPNNKCKRSSEMTQDIESNFDYCNDCGTIVYRNRDKQQQG